MKLVYTVDKASASQMLCCIPRLQRVVISVKVALLSAWAVGLFSSDL